MVYEIISTPRCSASRTSGNAAMAPPPLDDTPGGVIAPGYMGGRSEQSRAYEKGEKEVLY